MNDDLKRLTGELEEISAAARETFSRFSAAQINWRPPDGGWSVGQCFEHMIKSNELYFADLDRVGDGTRKNSLLEKYSPLTSFAGKFLVNSLKSDGRKVKTIEKVTPPSKVDARIVELFAAHQAELIGKIERTEKADWRKTVLTSPFMGLMTYTLADGLQSIVEHERRHFRQAERVTRSDGFPQ